MGFGFGWRPYVPVHVRRANAAREMARLAKKGHPVSPVRIEGRKIARSFWGQSWCSNLERYSDFASRLPRGRTYVRNGSVVDLQIASGSVSARVSGSELYTVEVKVAALAKARWKALCKDCSSEIDSLVELLQGRFSKGVMERICRQQTGLFPAPGEIELDCSCPDWATMCKHVAAVLYGIGARLDERPELLFLLRQVDEKELIARAGEGVPLSTRGPAADRVLEGASLSEVFGIEIAEDKPAAWGKRAAAGAKKLAAGAKKEARTATTRQPRPARGHEEAPPARGRRGVPGKKAPVSKRQVQAARRG